jgi:hypothetical protein
MVDRGSSKGSNVATSRGRLANIEQARHSGDRGGTMAALSIGDRHDEGALA